MSRSLTSPPDRHVLLPSLGVVRGDPTLQNPSVSMAEFPALPLFTDAFIGDTTHLNAAQTGAYIMLLIAAWRSPDCMLPNDDKMLARMARMDGRTWHSNRCCIMSFWNQEVTSQKWYQRRLLDERKYVDDVKRKNSDAGKASALKRKERHSTSVQPKGNVSSTPTPTPTPTKEREAPLRSASLSGEGLFADPDKSQPLKEKKNGKTKLPADFEPESATRLLATQLGVDLAACLTEFKDWCASKEPRYHDWQATFRNSVRRFSKSRGGGSGRVGFVRQEPASVAAAALRVIARHTAENKN